MALCNSKFKLKDHVHIMYSMYLHSVYMGYSYFFVHFLHCVHECTVFHSYRFVGAHAVTVSVTTSFHFV